MGERLSAPVRASLKRGPSPASKGGAESYIGAIPIIRTNLNLKGGLEMVRT